MATELLYTPEFSNLLLGAGLNSLWDSLKDNWIAPLFFAVVAVSAFMFIKSQQITKLIMFLVVAGIVGVLIFFGQDMFGEGGALSKMFQGTAHKVAEDGGNSI